MKTKTIIEYAIVAALIGASILAILSLLGNVANNVFTDVVYGLQGDDTYSANPPASGNASPASGHVNIVPGITEGAVAPDNPYGTGNSFFKDYGVNPRIAAGDDTQSTFAVDVDTGAYVIMRAYVTRGLLPPVESVRVEEYINFFEQGYASPAEGAFALYLEGAPSPYSGSEPYYLVRVGLKGYELSSELRPDSVLTFVIDVSGSMADGERLEMLKAGVEAMINTLRPTDQVAIVVYSDEARVILEHTPANDAVTLIQAVRQLSTEGSTNAEAGLALGYELAHKAYNPNAVNRVILCSDGVANAGNTGVDALLSQIKFHADHNNIYLTSVGVGMGDYNDQLLEQLADQGNGFYTYVDTYRETERVFVHQILNTSRVIAKDAKVQVEFNPDVVSRYRLIGYENRAVADEDFRNDKVDAGEIAVGHSVTALYEVLFHESAAQSDALTVYVRYQNPENDEVIEIKQTIAREDFAPAFEAASPRFQLTAVVAQYAEILRRSYWAEQSGVTLADIATDADAVAQKLQHDRDVQEFAQLVAQTVKLTGDQK